MPPITSDCPSDLIIVGDNLSSSMQLMEYDDTTFELLLV